jgi:hypothetical protein
MNQFKLSTKEKENGKTMRFCIALLILWDLLFSIIPTTQLRKRYTITLVVTKYFKLKTVLPPLGWTQIS